MNPPQRSISAYPHTVRARLGRHLGAASLFGGASLLAVVTAFAVAPQRDQMPVSFETVSERLVLGDTQAITLPPATYLREERIRRGDSLAALLQRLGIDDAEALDFFHANAATRTAARQLVPGRSVAARTSTDGKLETLHFPLSDKDQVLTVRRHSDGFSAQTETLVLQAHTEIGTGEIVHSLFGATDAAGIPDAVAVQLAEIFAGDIDFHRDLRKGDRFRIVYESLHHQGQTVRSGRILAAEFENDGKTFSAYWYADAQNKGAYYTAEGKSLRKAFLRSPLEFSRVTSGFSGQRFHPVLKRWRAHKGVDYGAPTGTRVRTVADGTVDFAGSQGGYGNLVIIRHQGNYSTAYAHLKGFASGIRRGTRISQGDTIGYVGQTGLASGPHLHYEFRIRGEQVNPLAVTLPPAQPLEKQQLTSFHNNTRSLRELFELADPALQVAQR